MMVMAVERLGIMTDSRDIWEVEETCLDDELGLVSEKGRHGAQYRLAAYDVVHGNGEYRRKTGLLGKVMNLASD